MDTRDFMLREFLKICQSPDDCDKGMLPSDCQRCGWDAVKTWRECAWQDKEDPTVPPKGRCICWCGCQALAYSDICVDCRNGNHIDAEV